MTKIEIDVTGMTCGHCSQSVTTELVSLEGVTQVQVDHTTGKALVEADVEISDEQLAAAIAEAGYEAASFSRS
jgi:copper chaperone